MGRYDEPDSYRGGERTDPTGNGPYIPRDRSEGKVKTREEEEAEIAKEEQLWREFEKRGGRK